MLLTAADIARRVTELGRALASECAGTEPLLVAPLDTAAVFLADLSRALPITHELDFVQLSRFRDGRGAGRSPAVRLVKDIGIPPTDRNVVVVDTIVDTGLTLNHLLRTLAAREPRTLSAVVLLDRPHRRLVDGLPIRHVGFTVPDELVSGYGLGVDERSRTYPDIRGEAPRSEPLVRREAAP